MSLKRLTLLALLCLALALPALAQAQAPAQGARTFAVLPFKVNSDKYRHMSPGAQAMMSSRLSWLGYFEPAPQANLARAAGRFPTGLADAQSIMGAIGSDYLIAGSIDFADNQASVDLKVYDRKGQAWTKTAQVPVDGLVPVLERLSAEVRTEVFKRPGEDVKAAERNQARKEIQSKVPVPKNAEFVTGDTGEAPVGTAGGPVMNPQFRYEGGSETPGRWQSQSLRYAAVNMVVGDIVGDKKNRVVIASENALYAYEFFQNTLKPVGELKISMRFKVLRVSLLDLDHDGRAEVIVSGQDDPDGNAIPRSYVYRYNSGKFEEFMPPQRMYLSVVRMPPTLKPALLGQNKGFHAPFDETGVSEMMYQNGSLQPVRKLHLPTIANLFNFTFLPEESGFKIVVLNEYNTLKVFTPDLDPQFSQEDGYNSSNTYIIIDERLPGMDQGKRDEGTEDFYYVPIRMIPVAFDSRGKYELLANKDISIAAQIFKKFRRFSQGEVHSLFWDGVGMSLAWKTRRIKGTVVDLALEDLKNEGKKQMVVCVNTYSGAVGASNEKTIVVTYDLNTD